MQYLISVLIVFFDQLLKLLVRSNFYYGQSKPLVKNVFHLTYVKNTGAAFGILQEHTVLFSIFSFLIIIFLIAAKLFLYSDNLWFDIGFALIIGGAIGNLIDRLWLGYVVDYLDFRIWPVFNLADSAVVFGTGIVIIFLLKLE